MNTEKQLLLDEIKDQIAASHGFIIAQYAKVSSNKANEFRRELAKVGSNFEVVKKRLFLKALETCGMTLDLDALPGHIGLVFTTQDPIETTKTVLKFSEKNENAFTLIGGRVDGKLIDAKDVARLAKLPSKDQMRAELLGLFVAPMAQTLSVLDQVLLSVPYCLDNKAKEGGQN